jgi:hypothetical protein
VTTTEIETAAPPSAVERNTTFGFYATGKRIKHWGAYGALWGALWGGLWGWLVVDLFWIPGIGHITAAGWVVASLATAAGAAVVGCSIGAIAAALTGVGFQTTGSSTTRTPRWVDVRISPES